MEASNHVLMHDTGSQGCERIVTAGTGNSVLPRSQRSLKYMAIHQFVMAFKASLDAGGTQTATKMRQIVRVVRAAEGAWVM